MGTVNVVINSHPYSVGCEDGQEAHVEALARAFDRQVREVGEQVGQVGDLRLFLMAALVTADELTDARERLARAAQTTEAVKPAAPPPKPEADPRVLEAIDAVVRRLDALSAQLE